MTDPTPQTPTRDEAVLNGIQISGRTLYKLDERGVNIWSANFQPNSGYSETEADKAAQAVFGALASAPAPAPRCEYCDGTGDVHSIDGEWRGRCTCSAPAPASGGVDAAFTVASNLLRDGCTYADRKAAADFIRSALSPAATPVSEAEPVAWRDVLAERRRQIEAEGWTAAHDDEHGNGEMARAAASYALEHAAWTYTETPSARLMEAARSVWPWDNQWWKPGAGRRMLVKAAALILAEIERLDRKEVVR